jgi:methylated-DNA-[protein]-cysteine S-methyltransferase
MFTKLYSSPLGIIEISANEAFVTSIMFRDAVKRIAPQLPETATSSEVLAICCQQFDEYFAKKRQTFDFPMQQAGTEFQQKVWTELMNIPFGKTISYLTLARRLGDEKCIRAAATANGRNSLTIVVPCHRVIGADGSLVGYGGDVWRKQWLLEHENALQTTKQMTLFG